MAWRSFIKRGFSTIFVFRHFKLFINAVNHVITAVNLQWDSLIALGKVQQVADQDLENVKNSRHYHLFSSFTNSSPSQIPLRVSK